MPGTVLGEDIATYMALRDCPSQLAIFKYLLWPQRA